MKIYSLKANHLECPVGYEMKDIVLSWKVDAVGEMKKHAQIVVSENGDFSTVLFDSGIDEDIDGIAYVLPIALKSRTRYYWRVSVTSQSGIIESATSYFETGKIDEVWGGKWIKAPFEETSYICKEFTIENTENARLYITAHGVYELYCNGKLVGDEFLSPGYYSYNLWEQSQTYDISSYLKQGENVLGVTLGDGWYRGKFGLHNEAGHMYGDYLEFIAEIHVDNKIILTDESWKCKKSPVVKTSIYDGEIYDARLETDNWSSSDCSREEWKNAVSRGIFPKISDRLRPPVKKFEEFEPTIIITPKNELVLDFGQNLAGWVEGFVDVPEGCSINLQHGEILQNDCFYNENLRAAKAEYTFISNGKAQIFRPRFTFYGFRYVKVNGDISREQAEKFRAYAIYSQTEQTGFIKTGSELVNRFIDNVLWGQKGNFLDVPTDCPQRDERLGWTGDTQIFVATALYNTDSIAFYSKFMKDLELEQNELNGGVPFVVPQITLPNWKVHEKDRFSSCAWGDVATVLPWTMYKYYGDKTLLEKHYSVMKNWVAYIKEQDENAGGMRLWQTGFHFADWLALDNYKNPKSSFGGTDQYFVASLWYAYSALLTQKAAKALGKTEDESYYGKLYEEIRTAIKKEYFTQTGRCAINTQTAKVLSLNMGIVEGEEKKRVAKDLVEQLKQNEMKLETGFCGTPFLCNVLSENGYTEEAYTLFLREEIPGWLYEVKMGATTVWERWNSVLPDGTMNPEGVGMNSLNHYAYGAVKEWLYSYVCGIKLRDDGVGCTLVDIAPKPDKRLGSAKCEYNSPAGKYVCAWQYVGDKVEYTISIPFGRESYVSLPNKATELLQSGEYKFVV